MEILMPGARGASGFEIPAGARAAAIDAAEKVRRVNSVMRSILLLAKTRERWPGRIDYFTTTAGMLASLASLLKLVRSFVMAESNFFNWALTLVARSSKTSEACLVGAVSLI